MKRRFVIALLALTTIISSGCVSREPIILVAEPKTPDWLMTPPINSDDLFYGVGEGNSAQASEKAALAHLSERLLVQITSQQEQRLTSISDSREYTEIQVLSSIQSKTERLPLGGYEILKQDVIAPQRTATLLTLKKSALIENLRSEVSPSLTATSEQSINTLADWAAARQQLTHLKLQQPLVTLLNQLGESEIVSTYSQRITTTELKIKDYQAEHPITVMADSSCKHFKRSLERLVLQAGFQINQSSGALIAKCQVLEDLSSAYGIHIAKADLSLSFIGKQSKVEHATALFIKSASSASESTAKAGLINALNRRIQNEDAIELLGF